MFEKCKKDALLTFVESFSCPQRLGLEMVDWFYKINIIYNLEKTSKLEILDTNIFLN